METRFRFQGRKLYNQLLKITTVVYQLLQAVL